MKKIILALFLLLILSAIGGSVYYFFFMTDSIDPDTTEDVTSELPDSLRDSSYIKIPKTDSLGVANSKYTVNLIRILKNDKEFLKWAASRGMEPDDIDIWITEISEVNAAIAEKDSVIDEQNPVIAEKDSFDIKLIDSRETVDSLYNQLTLKENLLNDYKTKYKDLLIEAEKEKILSESIKVLAKTYESMKPKELKPILTNVDDGTVIAIYNNMSNRSKKIIFKSLNSKRAGKITEILAGVDRDD